MGGYLGHCLVLSNYSHHPHAKYTNSLLKSTKVLMPLQHHFKVQNHIIKIGFRKR